MARRATNEDYNATSRTILLKVEIYFDGVSNPPLVVTRSNYLMSCSGLEETGAEDENPLGAMSANEIDLTLLSQDGLFNPANTSSIYYGKMILDLPIKVFIKPDDDEIEWDPYGVYYVTNWSAPSAGTTADVTAADQLQQVFRLPQPDLPVTRNQSFLNFFGHIFAVLGFTADISVLLSEELNFTYANNKPQALLQELVRAAMAYCTTDRNGQIVIRPFVGSGVVVATLTDGDQIHDMKLTQSILKTYDGVQLTYHIHQLTEQQNVLSLKGVSIKAGMSTMDAAEFTKYPLVTITGIRTEAKPNMLKINSYQATTKDVILRVQNDGDLMDCDIDITGIAVETVATKITEVGNNPLKLESVFIQNAEYAVKYQGLMKKFVDNPLPTIELSIRGNPLLAIGDKVYVDSNKYKLKFTGIVQRHTYEYSGGLTSKLTLLNALILEG